jgi:hypothetical protein
LNQFRKKDQRLKQELYMKRYNFRGFINGVMEAFAESKCDKKELLALLNEVI